MITTSPNIKKASRFQRTIKSDVSFSGIGIHTGTKVSIRFRPEKEGSGIYFKRIDLPGQPIIPATLEYVCDTSRSTSIGVADIRIHTIEHVLAAVRAFNIDNLCIEISSIEPPVGNGSSDVFIKMLESVGIEEQSTTTPIFKLTHPIYWAEDDIQLIAIPHDTYRISYTLSYPESQILKAQFHSIEVNKENFINEIAPCRTFSRYEEITYLMDRGLIKGGSLDNAVIIKDNVVFSKEGLFFPNEMVRHKILDLIGDLSLVGFDFLAHIISIRSGHRSNVLFAEKILNAITMEKSL